MSPKGKIATHHIEERELYKVMLFFLGASMIFSIRNFKTNVNMFWMYQFRIQFYNSSCKEEESDSMSLHMNAKQFIHKTFSA